MLFLHYPLFLYKSINICFIIRKFEVNLNTRYVRNPTYRSVKSCVFDANKTIYNKANALRPNKMGTIIRRLAKNRAFFALNVYFVYFFSAEVAISCPLVW